MQNIYNIPVADIQGNQTTLQKYKGKVLLIVNVASKCGLADKNYKELSKLLEEYHSRGLEVLLFPSNDFLNQEPGTLEEIERSIKLISTKFRLYDKINVLGKNRHPLYNYLIDNYNSYWFFNFIKWNFTKFLVDRDGKVVERYGPVQQVRNDKKFLSLFPETEDDKQDL